jgi:hypothetical protein
MTSDWQHRVGEPPDHHLLPRNTEEGMAAWQKGIIVLAAIFFAYAGFDGTKEYGIFRHYLG